MNNFEVGKVYVLRKKLKPGSGKKDYHAHMSIMMRKPDDYLHPLYKFFEDEPFLIVAELSEYNDNVSKKYEILIDGILWLFIHYDEPKLIEIELVC